MDDYYSSSSKRKVFKVRSYGFAAYELELIAEQVKHANSEEEWFNFVADSKNAISREHIM